MGVCFILYVLANSFDWLPVDILLLFRSCNDLKLSLSQEMIRLMRQRHFPAAFKCYYNLHKIDSISKDQLYYKMVIHVHSDSVFRRYQQEMRSVDDLCGLSYLVCYSVILCPIFLKNIYYLQAKPRVMASL